MHPHSHSSTQTLPHIWTHASQMERRCIIESLVCPTEKTSQPPAAGSHDGNTGFTPVYALHYVEFTGSLFNVLTYK